MRQFPGPAITRDRQIHDDDLFVMIACVCWERMAILTGRTVRRRNRPVGERWLIDPAGLARSSRLTFAGCSAIPGYVGGLRSGGHPIALFTASPCPATMSGACALHHARALPWLQAGALETRAQPCIELQSRGGSPRRILPDTPSGWPRDRSEWAALKPGTAAPVAFAGDGEASASGCSA